MKVYDRIKKEDVDLTTEELIDLIVHHNRQVDLTFDSVHQDSDGYLKWDAENWVALDAKRFIRSYFLEGRALSDSTRHNIYDLKGYFNPEEAVKVELG
ncbi:MAG: hypothetical protein E7423_06950 [Ruminococcaceae bacterium]|jgi:phosphoglucomutase|nr:hypothetical protein [Oscillospiraceae bacterium]